MDDRLHVYGIRHHGPGSAASVEQAIEALNPDAVLIEGPTQANDLIRLAGKPGMRPPLALMLYPKGYPELARFYPFAEFSPEWRALLWAVKHNKPIEFIDLPVQASLVDEIEAQRAAVQAELLHDQIVAQAVDEEANSHEEDEQDYEDECTDEDAEADVDESQEEITTPETLFRDPLDNLAAVAGYSDGESWWNALVEQSVQSPAVFEAINSVMAELRDQLADDDCRDEKETKREEAREAHMRLRIRDAMRKHTGPIAVVCGAWHAPALQSDHSLKDDKALLKAFKPASCESAWIPWTDQRIAGISGYAAGVISPGWYRYLWQQYEKGKAGSVDAARWQIQVANLLRDHGYDASTASVIEATRLTQSITAVRGLPTPGLVEMQDASLAALCHGDSAPLRIIESSLVIGTCVGAVDGDVPQPPLLSDLARLQRKLRLKPESIERQVRFDLRSDSGMAKSELLHRLNLLDVPWGVLTDASAGRGTFAEVWAIVWQPEFAVRLAEAGIYGPTVEIASAAYAIDKAKNLDSAGHLASLIKSCMLANLPQAVQIAIARLQVVAATAAEVTALMAVLPPLAEIIRYGTARELPVVELDSMARTIAIEVVGGYRYSCHQLDHEAATKMRQLTKGFDRALDFIDSADITEQWQQSLRDTSQDDQAAALVRGLGARLLHNRNGDEADDTAAQLSRSLSPSVPVHIAGDWVEGFIDESGEIFLHDDQLFELFDQWLETIDGEAFVSLLPMLRRSFSDFDPVLRRRLLARVGTIEKMPVKQSVDDEHSAGTQVFERVLPLLYSILEIDT